MVRLSKEVSNFGESLLISRAAFHEKASSFVYKPLWLMLSSNLFLLSENNDTAVPKPMTSTAELHEKDDGD
ncbi:hypothetical protein F2Q70_00039468 [Brassica cretica]|uniref:Uncharacterized protein n=1 Tax=Brassica cretica TaxID=69181 RepID=A0A8S9MF66_BRACR|nr:hypothetical protein F2Q70_00039468 [Brassica cretica]KAF2618505.1 hypothetical protein F2Q68_00040169 [Brassica cretica]